MLDPATVQILFADLQPPIVARSKTNPPQSLSRAASVLARCARLLGLPVHHSVVPEGGKAPEVLPDLAKETEGAPQFARMTADPFLDPQTREAINAVKRPVLVIAGFATEAVGSTLRFRRWRVITECRCPSTPAAECLRARRTRRSARSRQREA
jgi:hypothetical protein